MPFLFPGRGLARALLAPVMAFVCAVMMAPSLRAADTNAPASAPQPAGAEALPDLSARKKPPVIIIKIDDLRQIDGKVHGLWTKCQSYLKERNIKCGIGVICQTLAEATPEYVKWIKSRHDSGEVEFWFHGWDHASYKVDDKPFNEFVGRGYEEQKKRFDDSQKLAQEKLGFEFATFGPGGGPGKGTFDADTVKAMQDVPGMKVWLYPQPLDKQGEELVAKGKVKILDRVWAVNLESKVGVPDFKAFIKGYAKYPDREYFVLQGHPMSWGTPERFAEFARIIDFLVEQKAVFMTPSEFAATLK
ncbi:hypothetical protein DB346_14100 [Verrucomicrobia bacterium LW23]|nr:hypothetical protein DB346_14100 [Verrucomicrobia bacterium LW23]